MPAVHLLTMPQTAWTPFSTVHVAPGVGAADAVAGDIALGGGRAHRGSRFPALHLSIGPQAARGPGVVHAVPVLVPVVQVPFVLHMHW